MTHIILEKRHTHAGVFRAIGYELDVLKHDAEWLVAAGVARFKQGVEHRAPQDNTLPSEAITAPGEPGAAPAVDEPALPLQPNPLPLTPARPEQLL